MSKKSSKINPDKNKKLKSVPHPSGDVSSPDIFSSKKHSIDYVTVNGVILRTGYANKIYWYLLLIKELLDNAIDFLWKNYPGSADVSVIVDIRKDESLFHIKVRNTNSRNIPVFQNLSAIFDYDMRYGSKQNQHVISRGMLGDAMKQILAWPYVLIHTKDDGSMFTDRQWDKPLIIRCNGIERQIFLHVDKSNERIDAQINQIPRKLLHTDTEIEITWPIIDEVSLDIRNIERFCRQYIMLTTDIAFKFQLTDNSTDDTPFIDTDGIIDFTSDFVDITSPTSPPIKIDAPALHSISTKWNNISSIHSSKPEEFVSSFTSVYDKDKTIVYDVLRTFKEGTQVAKTPDTEISVAQLLQDPDKDKKLESLYYHLKHVLRPSERLSLSHLKTEERKKALINRITPLYPRGCLNTGKAVYRLIHGSYRDEKGILQFPFVFEIVAIPLSDEILKHNINRPSEFIGGVNYSIAPRSNIFEGDYQWTDKKTGYLYAAHDIKGILERCGFAFYPYSGPKVKLPCVIAANLVSPRIDYHGQAKTRIDTRPFSSVIIDGVLKIAQETQMFRAAGYKFYTERELREFSRPKKEKMTVQDVIEEVLEERKRAAGL
jgi:hypothetical protein